MADYCDDCGEVHEDWAVVEEEVSGLLNDAAAQMMHRLQQAYPHHHEVAVMVHGAVVGIEYVDSDGDSRVTVWSTLPNTNSLGLAEIIKAKGLRRVFGEE